MERSSSVFLGFTGREPPITTNIAKCIVVQALLSLRRMKKRVRVRVRVLKSYSCVLCKYANYPMGEGELVQRVVCVCGVSLKLKLKLN